MEISAECNPESIDAKKLLAYNKMGLTRLSLGVQSFDKKTLLHIARPHDYPTILKALAAIQKSPIKNYGCDFIMGLPYQTIANFKKQLAKILSFKIPHLSFYFLSYDTRRIDLFKAACPSEEIQIKMYHHLSKSLKKAGYLHYEVSNYALPGFECRHNLRYWEQQEYLGLGLGAHSYYDSKCFENEKNFDVYLQNPANIHEEVTIDPELKKMDYIMLQLRTHNGIDLKKYQQKFGDFAELHQKARPYLETGQLQQTKSRLHASEKGFLILDRITRDLI